MQSAVPAIVSAAPDILVIDISLDGPDGLELLKNIRLRSPRLPVLILSMHDESIYAERALRAGADGYILKQEATEKVLVALRRILSGEIYVSERIANSMLQHYVRGGVPSVQSPVAELTDRERGSVPLDRRRLRNPPDRGAAAPQREDSRILPGSHQR